MIRESARDRLVRTLALSLFRNRITMAGGGSGSIPFGSFCPDEKKPGRN
jgi:hypothetical protein